MHTDAMCAAGLSSTNSLKRDAIGYRYGAGLKKKTEVWIAHRSRTVPVQACNHAGCIVYGQSLPGTSEDDQRRACQHSITSRPSPWLQLLSTLREITHHCAVSYCAGRHHHSLCVGRKKSRGRCDPGPHHNDAALQRWRTGTLRGKTCKECNFPGKEKDRHLH